MLNRTVVFLSLLRRHYIGITNTIALCHDRHNLQKYHGCLTLKTAKFHTNSDVYISHNCCCASLLCIFVFCRAVRYSFDHINRVLMEIWVKIKQLISILFCGYRRRMPTTIADASRNLYSPGAQGAPASNYTTTPTNFNCHSYFYPAKYNLFRLHKQKITDYTAKIV